MEKIRFSYPHFTGGYGCSKPNVETDDYYRASEVDALLADVRALVDEVRIDHRPEANNCPICKALAAVEARIK